MALVFYTLHWTEVIRQITSGPQAKERLRSMCQTAAAQSTVYSGTALRSAPAEFQLRRWRNQHYRKRFSFNHWVLNKTQGKCSFHIARPAGDLGGLLGQSLTCVITMWSSAGIMDTASKVWALGCRHTSILQLQHGCTQILRVVGQFTACVLVRRAPMCHLFICYDFHAGCIGWQGKASLKAKDAMLTKNDAARWAWTPILNQVTDQEKIAGLVKIKAVKCNG